MNRKYFFLGALSAALASAPRAGRTGTLDLRDLQNITNQTVPQYGLADVQAAVQNELAIHNGLYQDMVANLAAPVPDRQLADASGQLLDGTMQEVDEYGRVRTQKPGPVGKVGFPLRRYQFGIGFTGDYLQTATPAQVATATQNAQAAHRRQLITSVRNALFSPVNYTFADFLTDNMEIPVKALYNGDGTAPTMGPNAEVFDGTHNHYLAFTSFTSAGLDALINTVAEHTNNAAIEVYINVADETAVRGFTGFTPALDSQIIVAQGTAMTVQRLDTGRQNNRLIGRYRGADIYVKSWVYSHYAVAVDTNAAVKPLGLREPTNAALRGLRMVGSIITFPLQSEYWGAEFGMGARNRSAAAVAQFNAAQAGTYQDPT